MGSVINNEGQVTDKELAEVAVEIAARVNNLFKAKTEWTIEQRAAAGFHLNGFINGEVTRVILENLMKKQQEQGGMPNLKPVDKS